MESSSGKDFRMLEGLLAKKAMVKRAAGETGKPLGGAETEVDRQISQVSKGQPVTKSGPED